MSSSPTLYESESESADDSLPVDIVAPSVPPMTNLRTKVKSSQDPPYYAVEVTGRCSHCSGRYVQCGEHVNGYPYWKAMECNRWLYSTPNGYWRITNSMRDFCSGAGYIITTYPHRGVPPDACTYWKSKHFTHVPVVFTSVNGAATRHRSRSRSRSRSASPSKSAKYLAALHKTVLPTSPIRNRTLKYELLPGLS
eukprot:TRINITY_DN17977_c0_g1_i1.p1 TRINITY_DN17977_c0_g1~~TRINITY_DN17977_c0_g1_i1.p1  ORF type:complete len:195 (+),score=20.92 TRINITY_DN17977_c0_g1_i1:52-636(+)